MVIGLLTGAVGVRAWLRTSKRKPVGLESFVANLHQHRDGTTFVHHLVTSLAAEIEADGACFFEVEPNRPSVLQKTDASGELSAYVPDILPLNHDVLGVCFRNSQNLVANDSPGKPLQVEAMEGIRPTSVLCVPVYQLQSGQPYGSAESPSGILFAFRIRKGAHFKPADLERTKAFGQLLSTTLSYLRHEAFTQKTLMTTLVEICDLLESKDPETVGHCKRVSILAGRIATSMELPAEEIKNLTAACRLLDLGKVGIPDRILKKTEALTDEEKQIVQQHPLISYELCKSLQLPESVLVLVRNHHEKLDGAGYPDGLKGAEIPMALRIVSAADSFDALRCPRSHRRAFSNTEALEILQKEAGRGYDEGVIEQLRELLATGNLHDVYPEAAHEVIAA